MRGMIFKRYAAALVLAASVGCGTDSADDMPPEVQLPPGLQALAGIRNDALRSAATRFSVPVETLAVVLYEKSRFEPVEQPPAPASPPADGVEPDMSAPPPAADDMPAAGSDDPAAALL